MIAGDALHADLRLPRRIMLERDDADALPRRRLLQPRLGHATVLRLRDQGGDGAPALGRCEGDDAVDLLLHEEAQEIDALAGDARIGREADDGSAALARHLPRRLDGTGKERADDELGALRQGLLRGRLRAFRRAEIVLHEEGDVGALGFAERQFGGVAHALRHHGPLPRPGHGQDQGDLDGSGADADFATERRARRWPRSVSWLGRCRSGNGLARLAWRRQPARSDASGEGERPGQNCNPCNAARRPRGCTRPYARHLHPLWKQLQSPRSVTAKSKHCFQCRISGSTTRLLQGWPSCDSDRR